MSSTLSRLAAATALGLALVLAGTPAGAQPLTDNQNTTLLSVGKMINLTNAVNRLIALVESHPAAAAAIPPLPGGNEKLDPYVAQMQQSPEVVSALKQSSLTPKAFLQGLYSLTQAEAAIQASQLGNQMIQPGFVADNIRTIRQNPSETSQLLRAYVRLSGIAQAAANGSLGGGKGSSKGATGNSGMGAPGGSSSGSTVSPGGGSAGAGSGSSAGGNPGATGGESSGTAVSPGGGSAGNTGGNNGGGSGGGR